MKKIEHSPLAPVLTDHVVISSKLFNDIVTTINELVETVNDQTAEILKMSEKIAQHTEDLSSLAKIIEEIYNET
jgi:methyl-accepting chemotaxis protein